MKTILLPFILSSLPAGQYSPASRCLTSSRHSTLIIDLQRRRIVWINLRLKATTQTECFLSISGGNRRHPNLKKLHAAAHRPGQCPLLAGATAHEGAVLRRRHLGLRARRPDRPALLPAVRSPVRLRPGHHGAPAIDQHEVTNGQYLKCVNEGGCQQNGTLIYFL